MQIEFLMEVGEETIPCNYQYAVSSALYKALIEYNPALGNRLHDGESRNRLKLFVFSCLNSDPHPKIVDGKKGESTAFRTSLLDAFCFGGSGNRIQYERGFVELGVIADPRCPFQSEEGGNGETASISSFHDLPAFWSEWHDRLPLQWQDPIPGQQCPRIAGL